ncbi:sodium- and chloride-dependent creatine transporter 1-like [Octopus sinensis]|uniref:Transporter n=1 Tax=Octopus sinensis TaxID=2607531 RepID=A0A7E6EIH9_9MOLL|nr:sodium- and chloride-dependent creatine transporter 1-like [Octopus sinensis]
MTVQKSINKCDGGKLETWENHIQFILSVVGYAVGLGNIWRFPYLAYANGGGAFLVPYFIFLLLAGIPLFHLEFGVGQFSSARPLDAFSMVPIFKGMRFVIYVTAILPYILITIILIRTALQPGASTGISYFIKPDWSRLKDGSVWIAAATQIFYSLGIGFGSFLLYASYNNFENKDAVMCALINCGTSIYAGFAVFSIIGYLSYKTGLPVDKVVADGHPAIFIFAAVTYEPFAYDGSGPEVSHLSSRNFPDMLLENPNFKLGKYSKSLEETFLEFDRFLNSDKGKEELLEFRVPQKEGSFTLASDEDEGFQSK